MKVATILLTCLSALVMVFVMAVFFSALTQRGNGGALTSSAYAAPPHRPGPHLRRPHPVVRPRPHGWGPRHIRHVPRLLIRRPPWTLPPALRRIPVVVFGSTSTTIAADTGTETSGEEQTQTSETSTLTGLEQSATGPSSGQSASEQGDASKGEANSKSQIASVKVVFSPGSQPRTTICQAINGARRGIVVMASRLTDPAIVDALASAAKRAVPVRVLLAYDADRLDQQLCEKMLRAGVQLRLLASDETIEQTYAVIDSATVLCGSYCWQSGSQNSCANLLVLNGTGVAGQFGYGFEQMWSAPQYVAETAERQDD